MIMCAVSGHGIDNPFSSGVVSLPPGGPYEWARTQLSEIEVVRWYYPTFKRVNYREGSEPVLWYFYLAGSYKLREGLFKPDQNFFESTNLKSQQSKTMKFSVASIVALVALFSQGLAASVQHCASYCRPLLL